MELMLICQSERIVIDELRRMWKESIVA